MREHKSCKPAELLLPYIDRYFVGDTCFSHSVEPYPLFPGTGLDLFIHNSSSFILEGCKLPSAHIVCSRKNFQLELQENKVDFIAIRFRSGAFRHFCSVNFHELNNSFLSVEDLWKQEGADLAEQVAGKSVARQIQVLNSFFLRKLEEYRKANVYMDHAISRLYADTFADLKLLAGQYNISYRHFGRCFSEEFGISPKRFQRITRFQSAVKKILLHNKDVFSVISEEGYYDQAHFIKECKSFSGLTPSEFIINKNRKYHFYHSRLK